MPKKSRCAFRFKLGPVVEEPRQRAWRDEVYFPPVPLGKPTSEDPHTSIKLV